MKQVEVQIMGQSYLLASPDGGEQRLLEAVEKVDSAMCKIRDAGKVRARDRIAVLTALNFAFEGTENPNPSGQTPTDQPPHAGSDSASSEALAQLIAKLDGALGSDGQLL